MGRERYSTDIPGQALAYKTGELTMTLDTVRAHVEYEISRPAE